MSATANIFTAVGTSWAASAVGFVAYAVKAAKKDNAKFQAFIAHIETEFDNVLLEVQKVELSLSALVPAPAPEPAPVTPAPAKTVAKRVSTASKRNLR